MSITAPVPATLLVNGTVHSPADPFATAMLVVGDRVAWVGSDAAARSSAPDTAETLDLDGALVTAAFVDAHMHTTATGLRLLGTPDGVLDLSRVRSADELLDVLERALAAVADDVTVLGEGWDDTAWSVPGPPDPQRWERVCAGRLVLLGRVDAHSSLASRALRVAALPDAKDDGADAHLTGAAHTRATAWAYAQLGPQRRRAAQLAALRQAAALGIGSVHEMGGPGFGGPDDLSALLALSPDDGAPALPHVIGYWGEHGAARRARDLGASGAAGDALADGSLGSRTAALREDYTDRPGWRGAVYVTAADVRDAVLAAGEMGNQAGFHVIGDGALDVVLAGFREAAARIGAPAVRAGRHRLEHLEMADAAAIATLADLGLVASVQPAFDARWGGSAGMYAARLGPGRAAAMNPYAAMAAAGMVLALGSDSPVTPLAPWEGVRAASYPSEPSAALSGRAAFAAATRGGWRAAGQDDSGVLAPGAPATYAVWEADELVVSAPDTRLAAWSTDPRSGTPGLPDLSEGRPAPRCLRTVVAGVTAYDSGR